MWHFSNDSYLNLFLTSE